MADNSSSQICSAKTVPVPSLLQFDPKTIYASRFTPDEYRHFSGGCLRTV
jgi:hypothetical protein